MATRLIGVESLIQDKGRATDAWESPPVPFARESGRVHLYRAQQFLDAHEPTLPMLGFGRLLE